MRIHSETIIDTSKGDLSYAEILALSDFKVKDLGEMSAKPE